MTHSISRILGGLLVAACFVLAAPTVAPGQSATQPLNESTFIEIADRILPSVVNIRVERRRESRANAEEDERYRNFFEFFQGDRQLMPEDIRAMAAGSGVLIRRIDDTGYILTNNHVLSLYDPNRQIRVTFHLPDETGTEFTTRIEIAGDSVRLIGRDDLSDLAILEVDLPEHLDVQPVDFADSDLVKVGENVLALGNPLDLSSTVTRGIVSAKSRDLSSSISLERLLQTDAPIQPGNSGGPLVNLDGKIVGINNAIASRSGLWQGIGFAIPSNDAKRISDELIEHGRVMRGFLGIQMQDVRFRMDLAREVYNIQDTNGVFVMGVIPNTPAEQAGVYVGDVIRRIDGRVVQDSDSMLRMIANKRVNEDIDVEVVRLNDSMEPFTMVATTKLTERPQSDILNEMRPSGGINIPEFLREGYLGTRIQNFGLTFAEEAVRRGARVDGIRVQEVEDDSPAAQAGLRPGDVVQRINGRDVSTLLDAQSVLGDPFVNRFLLMVRRNGQEIEIDMPVGDFPQ